MRVLPSTGRAGWTHHRATGDGHGSAEQYAGTRSYIAGRRGTRRGRGRQRGVGAQHFRDRGHETLGLRFPEAVTCRCRFGSCAGQPFGGVRGESGDVFSRPGRKSRLARVAVPNNCRINSRGDRKFPAEIREYPEFNRRRPRWNRAA